MSDLKALSLFSGAGGMDIGVKKSGFNVLAEIEIDKHCCETLRSAVKRERTKTKVIETDIREVDFRSLSSTLNVGERELDLLFGGPPCQPFSLAGKQNGLDDARGHLLFEIIRFAEYFKPKAILLEQVKGLLSAKSPKGEKGGVFKQFISELERIGYMSKWQVCCAADFGVPQRRERLFVVATYGYNNFSFPDITHAPATDLFGSLPYVTVGEAIAGLGAPSEKIKGTAFQLREDSHVDVTPDRDRERISYVPEGSYLAAQTHVSQDIRCNLLPKDTTKYLRLSRQKPSNALRCGEIFYHPTENRYLTPREYMRLHGYDDDYLLYGPIRSRTGTVKNLDQHRQVANSVPPPLAQAMGNQIRRYLEEQNI
ncbi:MAG: DNA cytosine methyltransferase [Deltaproteobacteria bacterium]|jgi:DNA (cytosine-5)-methyltransferase 1|nr:DNA cytosine methyltransferase [Deltaproteobacteria bacterium]